MDENKPARRSLAQAVIVSILLVLLPLLYVGSYLAIVVPEGKYIVEVEMIGETPVYGIVWRHYGPGSDWLAVLFSPLEAIDRKLRPEAWVNPLRRPSNETAALPRLVSPVRRPVN